MTTIPGDLSHLQPAHRTYALLANAERVDWIRQERWINYTRAEQVLVRLGELLRYPPRHRMPALLLFGATGMGNLRQRVRVLARQLEVRMLVIDEIHAMLSGTFREQRIFLNCLRP
jgi:Bacterial TniB protein